MESQSLQDVLHLQILCWPPEQSHCIVTVFWETIHQGTPRKWWSSHKHAISLGTALLVLGFNISLMSGYFSMPAHLKPRKRAICCSRMFSAWSGASLFQPGHAVAYRGLYRRGQGSCSALEALLCSGQSAVHAGGKRPPGRSSNSLGWFWNSLTPSELFFHYSYVCVCMCMYTRMFACHVSCICVCEHMHVCIFMYIYANVHMSVCVFIFSISLIPRASSPFSWELVSLFRCVLGRSCDLDKCLQKAHMLNAWSPV